MRDCLREGGQPIGVVDAKGNIYVAAGLTDHQRGQSLLRQKMSSQVTVPGTLV
jgi:hypothetical protein